MENEGNDVVSDINIEYEFRKLCGMLHDIRFSSKHPVLCDVRVKLQAYGLLRRLQATVIAEHHDLSTDEDFMKICSIMCLFISSKIFDSKPLTMSMLNQVPCFSGFSAQEIAQVELDVLKLLRFDVGRVPSVHMYEHIFEVLNRLKGILIIPEDDLLNLCGDVLHISFSSLSQVSMVLDNVSVQLGAVSCIAAAYALHEDGGIPGTLLYVLATLCTETSWDVGDLQLVANALLDQMLEDCPWHRYHLHDSSEDVLRILKFQ